MVFIIAYIVNMSVVEIVVVGSCNVDHITYTSRFPTPGETIYGLNYVTGLGGKGANQCVAASKLGAKCAMVGKVGIDSDGESYYQAFQNLNINTEFLRKTSKSATGIATIIVDQNGTNNIIIVPGANLSLSQLDIAAAESLIHSSKVVLCQNEISLTVTLQALKTAKSHGIYTIFNPAPAPLTELENDFFLQSDLICCNESEGFSLTGIKINNIRDAGKAALQIVKKGCQTAVLTLGENGCVFAEKGKHDYEHVPAYKVEAVDTTGAGDSLVGSLAFFIVCYPHLSLKEKLKRASYVAGVSVGKKGTQSSYPNKSELISQLFLDIDMP